MLRENGIEALAYHAGMSHAEREANQRLFLREDGIVMVATVAFGMGIDKPDVRFVAHIDMPKSPENFYQESGRAGRDGLPSASWLCYGLNDVVQLRQMIEGGEMAELQKQVELSKLDAMLAFCETAGCRRQHILAHFGEASKPCGHCDNCLHPPITYDAPNRCASCCPASIEWGSAFRPATSSTCCWVGRAPASATTATTSSAPTASART
ncbi:ATP-dependent DNA helicase recQ [Chromobacterium violaceum]|uniref:ATP-dependent DNA helicase RecQ n=1 Tax=Chromobacterium violaceum TaxID=536 RepID=A0A447T5T4_CHRVL|nr:ATP-dependent DNA helicase recQ [Chromobacterium violaceum]